MTLGKIVAIWTLLMFLFFSSVIFGTIKIANYVVSHGGVKQLVSTVWNGK